MNKTFQSNILILLLAVIFSVGLIFASLELPLLLDKWIQNRFNFLSFDQQASTFHISKMELYFQHYHLKTIGYACLIVLLSIIIFGFFSNKLKISVLGTIALFLPIFGHFTVTMFFLAGLGFLRFLWIPFTDISQHVMQLGDIILIPHKWIINTGKLLNIDLHHFVSVLLIALGILLFVFGVFAWFNTKYNKGKVVSSWVYKISRHPQYLGWIIWSYGIFLIPVDAQKRTWNYPDSLPLLLTMMIILAISLLEELKMKKKFGEEYQKFKDRSPFMFPLPAIFKKIIKHPLKLFFGTWEINNRLKVFTLVGYYTLFLMVGSYFYLSFTNPAYNNFITKNRNVKKAEKFLEDLKAGENRRAKDIAAMNLENYGNLVVEPLTELIMISDKNTNNFVVRTLGIIGNPNACYAISKGYENNKIELSYELIMALGKLNCDSFEFILLDEIKNSDSRVKSYAAWYLGQIRSKRAVEALLDDYHFQEVFTKISYLEALGKIEDKRATELLINELKSSDERVVEAAIVALSKLKPTEAVSFLQKLSGSNNWEIEIYAKEAIRIIEKHNKK